MLGAFLPFISQVVGTVEGCGVIAPRQNKTVNGTYPIKGHVETWCLAKGPVWGYPKAHCKGKLAKYDPIGRYLV